MKRSSRLASLHSLAQHEERAHSRAFGSAQQRVAAERRRLQELTRYRDEYRAELPSRSGSTAVAWQEHHRFLQRLDEAIAVQRAVVSEGEARREAHRLRWLAKRQRLESLTRALSRYEAAEQQEARRREAREQDDRPPPAGSFGREG